jgi:hypothetical protein
LGVGFRADGQLGVVLPLVRVADLFADSGELFEGLFLGGGAHPVEMLDSVSVGGSDGFHEVGVSLLRLGREVGLDERPAEEEADEAVFGVDDALPAGALHLLAGEDAVIELVVEGFDFGVEVRREAVDEETAVVVLQRGDRGVADKGVERFEELRLADNGVFGVDVPSLEPVGPEVDGVRSLVRASTESLL